MLATNFFHLNCNPVIPECGFQCGKCIQEIFFVIKKMPGVAEVSSGKHGEISGIIVQYDSEAISIDDLLNAFRKLPSFYQGFFVPEVLEA